MFNQHYNAYVMFTFFVSISPRRSKRILVGMFEGVPSFRDLDLPVSFVARTPPVGSIGAGIGSDT